MSRANGFQLPNLGRVAGVVSTARGGDGFATKISLSAISCTNMRHSCLLIVPLRSESNLGRAEREGRRSDTCAERCRRSWSPMLNEIRSRDARRPPVLRLPINMESVYI